MRGVSFVDRLVSIATQLWLPVLLLVIWWLVTRNSTSFYFPPLTSVLATLWHDIVNGSLPQYTLISMGNLFAGLIIAIVLGIALGLIIGEKETLRRVSAPVLNFLRAVPPASIVPIIIIALGVGRAPKIFIVALGCFWPILLNTIDGVRGTSPSIRETVRAYRIPPLMVLWRVALPAATPQIMAGARIAFSVSLVLMVISEFFGADSGLGFYITNASNAFDSKRMWAGTLLVGILGYILSALFLAAERRILSWYFQDARHGRGAGNAAAALEGAAP